MKKNKLHRIYFTAKDLGKKIKNKANRYVFYCPFSGKNTLEENWEEDVEELVYYELNLVGEPNKMSDEIEILYEKFLDRQDKYDSFIDFLETQLNADEYCCFVIYHPDGDESDFATLLYRLKTN